MHKISMSNNSNHGNNDNNNNVIICDIIDELIITIQLEKWSKTERTFESS